MQCKQLGRTGIDLPEIGLGTWEYRGGVFPLRKGISLGAAFVDTAERYETEEIVGEAVLGQRQKVFLATKVSPEHFRRADLFRAAENSLRRLRTDYIDLYQLHCPNYAVPIHETMAAMEALVEQGKVRFVGVSNFSVADLQKAQAAMHKYKIVSNQVRYNLIYRDAEVGLLRYCEENHITLIAYSPLSRGIENIRKNDPQQILTRVATASGKTEAQVALKWCVTKPAIIAIPKANSVEHTIENCEASDWSLTPEEVTELERGIKTRGQVEVRLRRAARRVLLSVRDHWQERHRRQKKIR